MAKTDQEVAPTTAQLHIMAALHVKISEDPNPNPTEVLLFFVTKAPFFSTRVKETGWSACHAIKDAVRESRHDFMANDSRANIGVGCRGDNQVELS